MNNASHNLLKDKLLWAAFIIGGFILFLTLWFGIGVDSAEYSYCASVWKHHGLPPYVGCMEKDWPGIFILHRVSLLFGETALGFRIFDVLFQLGSLVMIFYLAKRVSGLSLAGFLASIFYALYYYKLWFPMVGEREGFVLFFLLLAVTVSLIFAKKTLTRAVLVGLLSGFVFLIRPTFGLVWPMFFIWFLAEGLTQKDKKTWTGLGAYVVCCCLPALAVVAYYWMIGHLHDLLELTVTFVFQAYTKFPSYAEVGGKIVNMTPATMPGYLLENILRENLWALLGGVIGLPLVWVFGDRSERKLLWVLPALIAISLISVDLQRGVWEYHRTPFWGFTMVLAGGGYGWLFQKIRGRGSVTRTVIAICFLALVMGMTVLTVPREVRAFAFRYSFRPLQTAYMAQYPLPIEAADYVKLVMSPGDELYYFGNISMLPFLINKKLGAPFPFTTHLFQRLPDGSLHPVQQKWRRQYLDTFFKLKPRFFIYDDVCFQCADQSFRPIFKNEFPGLSTALEQEYHLVKKFDKIEIYELN
jgi:hypothetical protein